MAETTAGPERRRGLRCCVRAVRVRAVREPPLLQPRLNAEEAQQLSEDLQVLAHPIRLQILDILARHAGRVCVCDLEAALPVKQPTISHHLKLLSDAGLIGCERVALWAYYFVRQEPLARLRARLAERLASLG